MYGEIRPLYKVDYVNKLDNLTRKAIDGRAKPAKLSDLAIGINTATKYEVSLVQCLTVQGLTETIGSRQRHAKCDYVLADMDDWERSLVEETAARFDDPKDLKNAIRRIERQIEKHREGAFKYREMFHRAKEVQALDAAEAYLAEAGEVEARNVQARLDPTVLADEDDFVRFPPDTAELPREKQVVSNLRAGQTLPKFSQGDRKSTGVMVLEQQVRGNGQLKNLFEAQGLDIDNLQKVNPSKLQALLEMAERRRMINPRSAVALRKGLS